MKLLKWDLGICMTQILERTTNGQPKKIPLLETKNIVFVKQIAYEFYITVLEYSFSCGILFSLTPKSLDAISEQETWLIINNCNLPQTFENIQNRDAYCGQVDLIVSYFDSTQLFFQLFVYMKCHREFF